MRLPLRKSPWTSCGSTGSGAHCPAASGRRRRGSGRDPSIVPVALVHFVVPALAGVTRAQIQPVQQESGGCGPGRFRTGRPASDRAVSKFVRAGNAVSQCFTVEPTHDQCRPVVWPGSMTPTTSGVGTPDSADRWITAASVFSEMPMVLAWASSRPSCVVAEHEPSARFQGCQERLVACAAREDRQIGDGFTNEFADAIGQLHAWDPPVHAYDQKRTSGQTPFGACCFMKPNM